MDGTRRPGALRRAQHHFGVGAGARHNIMLRAQPFQACAQILGQGFIGLVEIGKNRVAAGFRHIDGVKHREIGRIGEVGEVGMPIAAGHARGGAPGAALGSIGNDAQVGLLGMVILIEDMARDGAEAAAKPGQLRRRQILLRKNQQEMLQQFPAQRRRFLVGQRAGEIEAVNQRSQRRARGLDRKRHVHSSMTSAADL